MAAFIGPLIGLGASLIGNAFKKKPKPDPMVQQMLLSNQLNQADDRAAVQPAKDFYTTALSGDQEALKSLLGPEINTVLSQYDTAAKTATELGPRGAGRNAILADVPFKKATTYGKALAGARSGAADKLATIGEAEEGHDVAQQGSLLSAKANQDKLQQDKDQNSSALLSSFGSGLGSLVAGKDGSGKSNLSDVGGFFSKIFGRTGGGTFDPTYGGGSGNTE